MLPMPPNRETASAADHARWGPTVRATPPEKDARAILERLHSNRDSARRAHQRHNPQPSRTPAQSYPSTARQQHPHSSQLNQYQNRHHFSPGTNNSNPSTRLSAPPTGSSAEDRRFNRQLDMYAGEGPSDDDDGYRKDAYQDGYNDGGGRHPRHRGDCMDGYDDGGYRSRDLRSHRDRNRDPGGYGRDKNRDRGYAARDDYRGTYERDSRQEIYDDMEWSSSSQRKRGYDGGRWEEEERSRKRQNCDYDYQRNGGRGRWRDDSRNDKDAYPTRNNGGYGGFREERFDRRPGDGYGRGNAEDRRAEGGYGDGGARGWENRSESIVDARSLISNHTRNDDNEMDIAIVSVTPGEPLPRDESGLIDVKRCYPWGVARIPPQMWECSAGPPRTWIRWEFEEPDELDDEPPVELRDLPKRIDV